VKAFSAILCCDASAQQGLGHLQRCRVLAQAIVASGGSAYILCITQQGSALGPTGEEAGFTAVHLEQEWQCLGSLLREQRADLLIIDHYRAVPDYQRQLEAFGLPWLQFDYRQAFPIDARWIVNINPFANADAYADLRRADSRLLLGSRYAILRAEFDAPSHRPVGEVRQVLVMLGGGDDRGVAQSLASWLSPKSVDVLLVTTRLNPRLACLQELASHNPRFSLCIEPEDVAALMRRADLAICAGGTTTFELVSQGVPFLSIALAANQINLCEAWEALGVSLHLGNVAQLSETHFQDQWMRIMPVEQRMQMLRSSDSLCDNVGAERIVKEIQAWL
jgi:UDP-2,4-diacetamido-2,4,6-trideoxy-beta-L-altropyranose hydrolase